MRQERTGKCLQSCCLQRLWQCLTCWGSGANCCLESQGMCCLYTSEMQFQSFGTLPYSGLSQRCSVWLSTLMTGTPLRHFIECKCGLQSLVKAFIGGPRTGLLHLV